jgi:hypothetical protein
VTIYRVEIDYRDDEVAQVRWFTDRAAADALVAEIQGDATFDGAAGRDEVMATLSEYDVDGSPEGFRIFLNAVCSTAEPE